MQPITYNSVWLSIIIGFRRRGKEDPLLLRFKNIFDNILLGMAKSFLKYSSFVVSFESLLSKRYSGEKSTLIKRVLFIIYKIQSIKQFIDQ